jgi:hypothetical protein
MHLIPLSHRVPVGISAKGAPCTGAGCSGIIIPHERGYERWAGNRRDNPVVRRTIQRRAARGLRGVQAHRPEPSNGSGVRP